jgi:hypothetical protein
MPVPYFDLWDLSLDNFIILYIITQSWRRIGSTHLVAVGSTEYTAYFYF